MVSQQSQLGDQALVTELAGLVVERTAPEEAPFFEVVAAEYFRDPERAVRQGGREEALGFGVDLVLIGPYALAVAAPAVHLLTSIAADIGKGLAKDLAKDATKLALTRLVRRMFRASRPTDDEPPIVLSVGQIEEVRDTTYQNAIALGLSDERARLLADATAGSLHQRSR